MFVATIWEDSVMARQFMSSGDAGCRWLSNAVEKGLDGQPTD